jgi:hypothetical protein
MNQPGRIAIPSVKTAIAVFIMTALLQLPLKAQNFYGSIVGIVTDSGGAVVPGASLTVTNNGTGQVVKVQTDGGGNYSVADLFPANYKVAVEISGFKQTEREGIDVQVGAVVRVDFSLAVGNASEVVEVNAAAPLLQTDTSSLNQQVEGNVVQQMPLNGRNVMNLIELAPGVIPGGSASGSTGLDQTTGRTAGGVGWNNYQIGGAIPGWSANYIDGAPNSLYADNIIALVPTQDAVQEFSVVTSVATADYGRLAGGVVNMSTKSGTNLFHGSVYEYFRNRALNANNWFNNHNGLPRTEWNQNQYGANVTGPIKRDKAFFMFTWENFKALTALTNTTNVPTAAMQSGTFTKAITDSLGNCNIVHDAAAGTWTIANLYGPGLKGGICGDPLNEVLKQYYPLPNASAASYNWILSTPLSDAQTQYNGRVDYLISSKQRLFGRYTYWELTDGHQSTFNGHGSPAPGSTTPTTWPTNSPAPKYLTHQAVLGDTYTLNSTTVFDVRANYIRQTSSAALQNSSVNEAQFDQYNANKYYTALASQMTVHAMPVYTLSGADNLFSFANFANGNVNWYNTYSLGANLTKILGPHSLKLGVEARLMDNSGSPYFGKVGGSYTYSNHYAGDEFAEFLMGYPSGGSGGLAYQFQTYQNTGAYSYYQGYYVMDDWRATRKLTLNVGLRYELPGAPAERNNKLAVLLPDATDPYTGITGTEALVNSSLYHPRTAVVEKHDLFAPRVGFAYRATDDTVLRGAYGIFYLPNDLAGPNDDGELPTLAPFVSAYSTVTISQAGPPTQLQTLLGQTVQSGLVQPSFKPPANFMKTYGSLTSYKGQILQAPFPYQHYPYAQQWNAALSHQFKGNLVASVGYAGLKGTSLPQLGNPLNNYFGIDELSSQYYSMGPAALSATSNVTTGCQNAPTLVGKISVGQCLRPNPYYADMQDAARSTAWQNYNSLQINAEKRLGSGGIVLANYTWSKNMSSTDEANAQLSTTPAPRVGDGTAGLQDYNNLANEYSLISDDVKNRFVLAYELNLPLGRGQKYANSLRGPANALASGWAVNGITIFQSGFPVYLQTATPNLLTSSWGAGILRPSVVPGCNKKANGGSETRVLAGAWFNRACFEYPSSSYDPTGQVTFGNESRVDPAIRADGIKNFDFALQKSTPMYESSSFVFRVEFFNIMNRVQYSPPINTYGSSNFGAIISQSNNPRQIQLSARINF